ncbi:SMC family ATPase [Nocardioides sp. HDW12B]|uniref:AAA family ATPase n=1 Tax=Nocardioides sp. HDW12B TaxID=2714939 RepID=UPI00140BE796|nr:SMC family ATPase [Nocardioides sp. HDW12B]QIK66476.1 SMC family ATPase [Nocardioides sp. HDW12B]
MRFHRLSVTAFGPYAGTEVIDFESLNAAGIFLMTGKTGAGKTSLLDAVCFALYGVVPGERGVKSLRSHHASADARPEVVLELTLGGRRLRIHRTPEWHRPKKRGTGTTKEQAAARLVDLTDGHERLVSHRIQEVGHELRELLGMTSEQFMQVVLLPQGRFQTFLRATSDERQQVLQTLFATQRFSRIEDWMHDEARRLRDRSADGERRVGHLLGALSNRAGVAVPEALGDLARGDVDALSEKAAAWADTVVTAAAERAVAAARDADEARSTLTDLEARLARAERESPTLRRRDEALRTLAALEDRAEELTGARTGLAAHARAATVAPLADSLDVLDRALAEARSGAARRRSALRAHLAPPGADRDPAGDRADQDDRPESTDGDDRAALEGRDNLGAHRDALLNRVAELRRLAPLAEEVVERRRRLELTRAAVAEHTADLDALATEMAALPQRRSSVAAAVSEARERAAAREGLAREVATARRRHEAAAAEPAARAEAERLAALALTAREDAAAAHEEHLALFERRLLGMADELARQLEPGEPCTVCGSRDHPAVEAPDDPHGDELTLPLTVSLLPGRPVAVVTEADQAASLARHARAQERADAARSAADAAATALALLEQQAEGRSEADARTERDAVTAALDAAEAAAAELPDLVARLESVEHEQTRSAATRDGLVQARREHELRADRLAEELTAEEQVLAAATVGHASVEEALAHEQRTLHLVDAVTAAEQEVAALEGQRATAAAQTHELAVAHGFADLADARAALLPADRVALHTRLVDELDRVAEKARHTLEDPDALALLASLEGRTPEDPTTLGSMTAQARGHAARVSDLRATTADADAALTRLAEDLTTALTAWAPHQARHATADRLARLVRGMGSDNQLQMRLSSYVLATRLDQVLDAANERLAQMRDHRYELQRTSRGRGGTRVGLGLEVLDAWTGQARDAATLSGGETFVVSLALALGLADVVGEESGGTRVDTLFVDEGFSALDPDTLDDVMDRIDALRAGGRTVGVVSHVSELRTRIPTQLHVESSRAGSTVRMASTVA